MLFFVMIALPMLLLGSTLAGDITYMVKTNREVSNATEAAAVAGAFQFQPGSTLLVRTGANSYNAAAQRLIAEAESNGSVSVDIDATVDIEVNPYGGERVIVTSTYTLRPFGFYAALEAFFGGDDAGGRTYTVVRTADVCIPGVYSPTGGACARPTHR